MTDYPFHDDVVDAVADARGIDRDGLSEALAAVQRSFECDDGGYEYSNRHHFGWRDDQSYYLYGSEHLWERLGEELELDDDLTAAARDAHYREMVRSAEDRGERDRVREMLDADNEPLVLVGLEAEGPPPGMEG
ncbi:hypothetical protein [Haloprofundus salilacus]|uniref:hypothetical protein n=1 Tax=Haloprofundus salilacus TaxID=2876190 RepID=UPI001CCA5378|nr:hypothetical protein [Haloprofundus salilacus]